MASGTSLIVRCLISPCHASVYERSVLAETVYPPVLTDRLTLYKKPLQREAFVNPAVNSSGWRLSLTPEAPA
jgi:hypothetical protein